MHEKELLLDISERFKALSIHINELTNAFNAATEAMREIDGIDELPECLNLAKDAGYNLFLSSDCLAKLSELIQNEAAGWGWEGLLPVRLEDFAP